MIRPEKPEDAAAIHRLTEIAFKDAPHSDGTEHLIVDRLRMAGALTLSLVAVEAGEVVGHVAFSPVQISSGEDGWYGLGPVSVLPALQRQGIGSALIRQGLSDLSVLGARGCVLLGNPGYYERFGFEADPNLTLADVPPEYFLRKAFSPVYAGGAVTYHPGFYG
ncbi:GNAT family N-acetyltransferase [Ferirhizobium litorale]